MPDERELLGERITDWLSAHSHLEVVDRVVVQSSDDAFHCLSIVLFYSEQGRAARAGGEEYIGAHSLDASAPKTLCLSDHTASRAGSSVRVARR